MRTTDQPMGTVLRDGDRVGLRYERRLPHSPEKVWRALTESEHIPRWLPCDMIGDRREGGAIELRMTPALVDKYEIEEPTQSGTIVTWDPPRVFEWTWDADVLRFELEPTEDGTLLTLTTWLGDGDPEETVGTAAGYHVCLGNLADLLDTGEATPLVEVDPSALEDRYRELF
jgi:uncharacterized protein YndB with AHSA1/START domain